MAEEIIVVEPGNGTVVTQRGGSIKKFNPLFQRVDDAVVSDLPSGNGKNLGTPILIDLGSRGKWNIGVDTPNRFTERLMGLNRYTDDVWADLVLIGSFSKFPQLLRQDNPVVKLGVTAPYAYLKGIDTGGLDVEKTLIKSMRGVYDVPYRNSTVKVRVSSVKVWGEGLVGYAYFAYDKELKLKPDYANSNTLYLDIGRDTLNTALMTGGQAHRDTIKSDPVGVNLLYRMISRELDQTAGAISEDQVERLILSDSMTAEQKKVVTSNCNQYIEAMIRYVRSVEGRVHVSIDRLCVFGGAVKVIPNIEEIIKEEFKKTTWGDEFTNARGCNLLVGGIDEWDEGIV
jgi:hypothetical protein